MTDLWTGGTSTPILPVRSISRSVAFYRELGFDVETYDDGYAFVRADGITIDLSRTDDFDPFTMAGMAYLTVADSDAVHSILDETGLPRYDARSTAELQAAWDRGESLARMSAVADTPWRMREFALADPDNNLLRIGTSSSTGRRA